jgi:carboxymethylenebutenolidase
VGELVEFTANGGTDSGYLAIPRAGRGYQRGPGVIVIQEWWGLVEHIKNVCDRFADAGFVALAPDLYHGKTTTSPDEAGKLMMAMQIDQAEKDLSGAVKYLLDHDATTGDKVGVVGFCMGGALALYAAAKNANINKCVVFYGIHPNVKPDLPNLQAPVLGNYAGNDAFVTPETVNQLEQQLQALGKQVDFKIYPGTNHAFFNDTRPEVYNAEAANDAWQRTINFLRST